MNKASLERRSIYLVLAIVMIILALVLPFAYRMDVGPGPDSIRAMTWDYIESEWFSGFRLWNPLDVFPYTFLRLLFAVFLARFCVGNTTAKETMIIGILAELQPIVVSAPQVYLIDWSGDPLVPLYIPIPIILIFGIILVLILKHKYGRI